MTSPREELAVSAVRSFNRFYTRLLGLLQETLLSSPVSLTEARVLWEISHSPRIRAEDLISALGVDRGYLSRILRHLERERLVSRVAHARDGRMRLLSLTQKGRAFMRRLDAQASGQIRALLGGLSQVQRTRLVGAMRDIEALLTAPRLHARAAGHRMSEH